MKRNSLLILLFLLPFLSVMPQPKQNGRIPAREKRGYDLRKVIGMPVFVSFMLSMRKM